MTDTGARAQYELAVTGMSCESCVAHVEEALQLVSGVRKTGVDLESGRVVIEGNEIDSNQLVEAVTQAGYGVRSTKQEPRLPK